MLESLTILGSFSIAILIPALLIAIVVLLILSLKNKKK